MRSSPYVDVPCRVIDHPPNNSLVVPHLIDVARFDVDLYTSRHQRLRQEALYAMASWATASASDMRRSQEALYGIALGP